MRVSSFFAAASALTSAFSAVSASSSEPQLHLPNTLGAAETNESYHGRGPDGRIWFTRANKTFTSSALLTCAREGLSCNDARPAPFLPQSDAATG